MGAKIGKPVITAKVSRLVCRVSCEWLELRTTVCNLDDVLVCKNPFWFGAHWSKI